MQNLDFVISYTIVLKRSMRYWQAIWKFPSQGFPESHHFCEILLVRNLLYLLQCSLAINLGFNAYSENFILPLHSLENDTSSSEITNGHTKININQLVDVRWDQTDTIL